MDGPRPGVDKELAWWERVPTSVSGCLRAIMRRIFEPYEAALMAFLNVMA